MDNIKLLNGDSLELNKIYLGDCFPFMQKLPEGSIDIIYTDPPYNMNSRYYIDKRGHYKFYGKGSDFMSKWDVWDGEQWDAYFKEATRILKYGGFIIMHNIDRQSDLWTYYARRNNLFPMQKLYWLFITNFPKAVDVALAVDKKLGKEREDDKATSELAQKYDGYKYGQAALKQILEEILVFWKYPKESVIDDIVSIESAHKFNDGKRLHNLHASVLNIKKTLVPPSKSFSSASARHTPQLLVSNDALPYMINTMGNEKAFKVNEALWNIPYLQEDIPPYIYEPKASTAEKEDGLEELEVKMNNKAGLGTLLDENGKDKWATKSKNPHPTPKPIKLCKAVLELFNTPEQMLVLDTFAGQGSIPKACKEMGINFLGTELNEEYHRAACLKVESAQETLFG